MRRLENPIRSRRAANGCASPVAQRRYFPHSILGLYRPGGLCARAGRIFCGRSWAYVALEAEIPTAGDFKRTIIGDKPVVVVRDQAGGLNVVENRCAHRGVQFCQTHLGHATEFMCPYHQWTYNLRGDLIGVPFRRGIKQQGGMPADFALKYHGLRKLQVATRHGVVFASFADEVEPLEDYLGLDMLKLFDRVFDGREVEVLGTRDNSSRPTGS